MWLVDEPVVHDLSHQAMAVDIPICAIVHTLGCSSELLRSRFGAAFRSAAMGTNAAMIHDSLPAF